MIVYQFLAHRNNRVQFDPKKHISKETILKQLGSGVGRIVIMAKNGTKTVRVTLRADLVDKTRVLTNNSNDVSYWFWNLDEGKWEYFDMNNVKYFELED